MKHSLKKIVSVMTATSIIGTSIVLPPNVPFATSAQAASVSEKAATDAISALFANNNPSTNVLKTTTNQQTIDAAQQLLDAVTGMSDTAKANAQAAITQARALLDLRNTPQDYSLFANDADITSSVITGIVGTGITRVSLLVDGVVKATGTIVNGTYSILVGDSITPGSQVEVAGYNGTNEVARKTVKVSNNAAPLTPGQNEALAKTMASNAVMALFQNNNPTSNTLNPATTQKTIDYAQSLINVVQTAAVKASLQQELDKAQSLLNASPIFNMSVVSFKLGKDSYVTGQFSGNVAKISLTVNGASGVKIPVTAPAIKYYAKTVILNDTDDVTLIAYDAAGNVLGTKKVVVEKQEVTTSGSITSITPYNLGTDSYVTGQYSGDVAKISLTVNGVEGSKIDVTSPDFKYYAKRVILKNTDNIILTAYDANGRVLDTKTVTLANQIVATGSITTLAPFVIGKEGYVTGQFSGDVAKISLTVNGVEGVKIPVTAPAIKYYAKTVILNTTDSAHITAYDINGNVLDTKVVSLSK